MPGTISSITGADALMKIDLDKLGEAELIELNHRIVERLRYLRQQRTHEQMLAFRLGKRVAFQPEGIPPVVQ